MSAVTWRLMKREQRRSEARIAALRAELEHVPIEAPPSMPDAVPVRLRDQALFDSLWRYAQCFLNDCGLMSWYIAPDGQNVLGAGGATDSDEDMAWALVMAHRQWGGRGGLRTTSRLNNSARAVSDKAVKTRLSISIPQL